MTRLGRYEHYRAHETPLFETLPAHWKVTRVRYLCDIGTGSGDTIDAEPDGRVPFYVRSDTPLWANAAQFSGPAVLTAGDGAGVAKVFHLVRGEFAAHQRVYVLRHFRDVSPAFFYYYFSCLFSKVALDGSAKSTVDSVRRHMIADMPFALPSPAEQDAITRYLNREAAAIDALISKQEKLIGLLGERRAATQARYFYGHEGKRLTTVRRVLSPLNRPAGHGLGVITAYRDGVVTLRSNRRDEGYTFSETEGGYQEVLPGDLVFHALDGFAGAVGISDSRGNATPVYHVCRVTTDDDPAYLALLLRFMGVSGFLATQAPNVRQRSVDFRNWGTFARVPLALPVPESQREIVADIMTQTAKIDALIGKAQRFIELAKERRAALITAAVTGQIDVRGAA